MLKDCLEVFRKIYEEEGDSYILSNYVLDDGMYILIGEDFDINNAKTLEVRKKEVDRSNTDYGKFSELDYLSRVLNTNKAIDIPKKVIQSNNYLSFVIKTESLKNGKLTKDIINNYYNILANPITKYNKDKKSREIYENFEKSNEEIDKEKLENIRSWILENIWSIPEKIEIKNDKGYLKVFFKEDIEVYKRESNRYLTPNIYNKNEYNEIIEGKTFGLPDNNMGLNDKKPFLRQNSRKNPIPYLIDTEEVILQRRFFDYLLNKASDRKNNVYIYNDGIHAVESVSDLNLINDDVINGIYLRTKKSKELEIIGFDIVERFTNKIENFKLKAVLPIGYKSEKYKTNLRYEPIEKLTELSVMIDKVLFKSQLLRNIFEEASNIKVNDKGLKEAILTSRHAFVSWFYKGSSSVIKGLFPSLSLKIIKNSILEGKNISAKEQLILREGVIRYFNKGEGNMESNVKEIIDEIKKKINSDSKEQSYIESDSEYFFAIGQLASYLLSKSKANKKPHSMINTILNAKSDKRVKEELRKLFKKYNYEILSSKRFNRLYAMILAYEPKEVNEDMLLCGYLHDNLIYSKEDKDNE